MHVDSMIHDGMCHFVRREYPHAILLDEWIDEHPITLEECAELAAQRVLKWRGRMIIATRVGTRLAGA